MINYLIIFAFLERNPECKDGKSVGDTRSAVEIDGEWRVFFECVIRHDSSIEDDLRVSGYSYLCQKYSSIKHEWHSSTQPCLEPVMAKTLRQSQHDWRSAVSIIYVIDASTT